MTARSISRALPGFSKARPFHARSYRNKAPVSGRELLAEGKCKRLYARIEKFDFKRAIVHGVFLPDELI